MRGGEGFWKLLSVYCEIVFDFGSLLARFWNLLFQHLLNAKIVSLFSSLIPSHAVLKPMFDNEAVCVES